MSNTIQIKRGIKNPNQDPNLVTLKGGEFCFIEDFTGITENPPKAPKQSLYIGQEGNGTDAIELFSNGLVTPDTYTKVTVDNSGRVIGGSQLNVITDGVGIEVLTQSQYNAFDEDKSGILFFIK